MVCLNPRLRQNRHRKGQELLAATEAALGRIVASAHWGKPSWDQLNRRIGNEASRWKVLKHFFIKINDTGMTFRRNQDAIDAEAQLDGTHVMRTSLDTDATVEAYKNLALVERAFRLLKATSLKVRPLYVYNSGRVRAHVFPCMLAYHLEWHMNRRLAPILFEDHDRQAARQERNSPVAKATVSDAAKDKPASKTTTDGLPVYSLHALLTDLAAVAIGEFRLPTTSDTIRRTCECTPVQEKAFKLLDLKPECSVTVL